MWATRKHWSSYFWSKVLFMELFKSCDVMAAKKKVHLLDAQDFTRGATGLNYAQIVYVDDYVNTY